MWGIIITVLMVLIGISFLVIVHELGHFIVAKWTGVRVEAFALGLGPKIFGIQYGKTDYRLCLIPLGGYVKLAGESGFSGDATGAPDEFISKPPVKRIYIFAAGAIMNLIASFPLCILTYVVGVNFAAPLVGQIAPGSPEWNSGLQAGDTIITVNNQPILSLEDYNQAIFWTGRKNPVAVKGKRYSGEEFTTTLTPEGITDIGVIPRANIISDILPNSSAQEAGLKVNDEIIEINGNFIYQNADIDRQVQRNIGQIIPIKIRRPGEGEKTLSITPRAIEAPLYDINTDGLYPPIIGSVKAESPAAKAGLKPYDKIIAISCPDGTRIEITSWLKFVDTVRSNGGNNLTLSIVRDEKALEITDVVPHNDPAGKGSIGVIPMESAEIGEVPTDSLLASAGLKIGDIIIKVNGKKVDSLSELRYSAWQSKGKSVNVEIKRGQEILNKQIKPNPERQGNIGIGLKAPMVYQRYPFIKAISVGSKEVLNFFGLTYLYVWRLFKREESTKGLSGPVGIFKYSYLIAREGISKFLWLLALFSLNLAIFNLLPIPILDGGGVLFALIERIKGSPVSLKVMAVAQYVGLFILLSLVFLATYNDVFRGHF